MSREKSWAERLAVAKKRRYFTRDDRDKILSYATCFIGERYEGLIDIDKLTPAELSLVSASTDAVLSDDVDEAERIYNKVQKLYTPALAEKVEGQA